MSFAVWMSKPPFGFAPGDAEQIFMVGDVWVVTDEPRRATPAEVDAVLNPPPAPQKTVAQKLAPFGLTIDDLKAALTK